MTTNTIPDDLTASLSNKDVHIPYSSHTSDELYDDFTQDPNDPARLAKLAADVANVETRERPDVVALNNEVEQLRAENQRMKDAIIEAIHLLAGLAGLLMSTRKVVDKVIMILRAAYPKAFETENKP